MQIERLDPLDLDLDAADALAAVVNRANEADGVGFPETTGPTTMKFLQQQSDGTPVDGLWMARDDSGQVVGRATLVTPRRANADTARVRVVVAPGARRQGVGGALLDEVVDAASEADRRKLYSGTFDGSPGPEALPALGFDPLGTADAVRRLELDHTTRPRWQRLYDEAAARSGDYELIHLVGPTPPGMLEDLVVLHEAINDAPPGDPEAAEEDAWDAGQVTAYDRAMAARSQTVYRVLARHRASGEWAGMSMLCVDEFAPAVAFQEDTSVVRKHRGHRLGLLMKADMLRWVTEDRPEVGAIITWNATNNHHMIAVNEMLGTTVVTRNLNYRKELRPS